VDDAEVYAEVSCPRCGNSGSTAPGSTAFAFRYALGEPKIRRCNGCGSGLWIYMDSGQTEVIPSTQWAGIELMHETVGFAGPEAGESPASDEPPEWADGLTPPQVLCVEYFLGLSEKMADDLGGSVGQGTIDRQGDGSIRFSYPFFLSGGAQVTYIHEISPDGRSRGIYPSEQVRNVRRSGRRFRRIGIGRFADAEWLGPFTPSDL
jgi:hypothetical protein